MSKNFSLNQLTEGIRQRHLGLQNRRLVEKWSRTGLLRGLEGTTRENMSMMLENQAAQLLREENSLSGGQGLGADSGDIRGFTNIAFPIVRRVFGGLVANDLVSIQPMSLPSGLLFYLDYQYGTNQGAGGAQVGGDNSGDSTYALGDSIYNNPGGNIQAGSDAQGGQYDLAGSGYSKVHEEVDGCTAMAAGGSYEGGAWANTAARFLHATGSDGLLIGFDPAVVGAITDSAAGPMLAGGTGLGCFQAIFVDTTTCNSGAALGVSGAPASTNVDLTLAKDIVLTTPTLNGGGDVPVPTTAVQAGGSGVLNIRRLNRVGTWDTTNSVWTDDATSGNHVLMIVSGSWGATEAAQCSFVVGPTRNSGASGDSLVVPAFESDFGTGNTSPVIPEIDIKIESIAVTAATRKLRARWSPELAQDLNAYHSLDAEVELTQIPL